jgi:hypothetical protein
LLSWHSCGPPVAPPSTTGGFVVPPLADGRLVVVVDDGEVGTLLSTSDDFLPYNAYIGDNKFG